MGTKKSGGTAAKMINLGSSSELDLLYFLEIDLDGLVAETPQ